MPHVGRAKRSEFSIGLTSEMRAAAEAAARLMMLRRGAGDTTHSDGELAEGMVSKRRGRPYRSGRTKDWIKVSINRLIEAK
ncbi:hypothetical protein ACVI1L_004441 [Bradyrhizobium sp. USDA 4516]